MEFRILGPLQVLDDGVPVEIAGAKQQVVLALLVLRANEMVGSERLIDELWGERPPRNAAGALYNHVSRLRKVLGPDVLARREWGYVLRTPPESIDLRRFEAMLSDAEQLPARERSQELTKALALWRGPPLAGLESEAALQREIARLEDARVDTIERRIDADLEAGRNSDLVGELESLIALHPVREHLRWQLILSLYRAGRQAEALEVYRETRRVLAEELGLEPSPELRELERAILRQDPSLAIATAPARAPGAPPEPPAARGHRRRLLAGLAVLFGLGIAAATTLALVLASADHPSTEAAGQKPIVVTELPPQTTAAPTTPAAARPPRQHRRAKPASPTHTTAAAAPATTSSPPTTGRAIPPSVTPANTTKKKATPPRAPTTPRLPTITDKFNNDSLDPTIWGGIQRTDDNVSIAETGGQLQITVGAQAQPALHHRPSGDSTFIDVHVGTDCSFPGDFDARVDYTLLEWPAGDEVFAFLGSAGAGGAGGRLSLPWGDYYEGWVSPNGSGGDFQLSDGSGSLRIVRVKGSESVYWGHHGSWTELARGYSQDPAIPVLGMSTSGSPERPFGHQEAKVAFDNLVVTGANPNCPLGSKPSGP